MMLLSKIQEPVQESLGEVKSEIRRILTSEMELIDEIVVYLLNTEGKLFRPTLVLLSGGTNGNPNNNLVTMAAVVELIHTATLIHDDTIDGSATRRGFPTVNEKWSHEVSVIMGDYLFSRSFSEMVKLNKLEVMDVVSGATVRMTRGEMMEIGLSNSLEITESIYYQMISEKTASLMSAACEIGALLGGGTENHQRFRAFGEKLGMAFQIADDIFDYNGNEKLLGKPTGSDIRERKVTLPLLFSIGKSTIAERKRLEGVFFAKEISEDEVNFIVELVNNHEGVEYARKQARLFAEEAAEFITPIPDSPHKDALFNSIEYVIVRDR